MTNTHNDVTETAFTARRRQVARVFTVGVLAAGAVVALAVPAQAAGTGITGYHIDGASRTGSRVVADPGNPAAAAISTLTNGTAITIDCGVRASSVHGDTVWHHITAPVTGYVTNYYTDTPSIGRFLRDERTCRTTTRGTAPSPPVAVTPAPAAAPAPAPAITRGATMDYNEGVGGSCVYYALNRFHEATGVYPRAIGDARLLATRAAAGGWAVGSAPRVDSLVVFQPGQNGASAPYGHAAWVEQVSGDRIYIAEMNAPTAWVVTHRWLTPVAGVKYIYTS